MRRREEWEWGVGVDLGWFFVLFCVVLLYFILFHSILFYLVTSAFCILANSTLTSITQTNSLPLTERISLVIHPIVYPSLTSKEAHAVTQGIHVSKMIWRWWSMYVGNEFLLLNINIQL